MQFASQFSKPGKKKPIHICNIKFKVNQIAIEPILSTEVDQQLYCILRKVFLFGRIIPLDYVCSKTFCVGSPAKPAPMFGRNCNEIMREIIEYFCLH